MSDSNSILLVEPDSTLQSDISDLLKQAGFEISLAHSGEQALRLFHQNTQDLVITDLYLPDMDGIQVCIKIHENTQIPVLMIIPSDSEQDILSGFDAGAADILTLPIRPQAFMARVRTALKRTSSPLGQMGWLLRYEDLVIDLRSQAVVKSGRVLALSRNELTLLSYFMRHSGDVISKEDLLKNVWGYENICGDLNMIDTAIKRLRRAIGDDSRNPNYIHTVWGRGYCFGK